MISKPADVCLATYHSPFRSCDSKNHLEYEHQVNLTALADFGSAGRFRVSTCIGFQALEGNQGDSDRIRWS